jgi:uncharacterized protein (TIGR04222 family)
MNPFDLTGPEFLVFYIALAAGVHLLWRPLVGILGAGADAVAGPEGHFNLANLDPYLIAYLRGQEAETARVAIISLLDRGLLHRESEELIAEPGAGDKVHRPLERAILQVFADKEKASSIFKDAAFRSACVGLEAELSRLGLLPSLAGKSRILLLRLASMVLLVGVAFTKIKVAFERGHPNVGFLVILAFASVILMLGRKAPKQTRTGERLLRELRERFDHLKSRADDIELGGVSRDLVLLAAIFGMAMLPELVLAQAEALFPRAVHSAGVAGSSCGSSCGTSCGTSSSCGGSSCGGGGCGGGCGGCGG